MLLDGGGGSGKGPLKPTGTVDKLMQKPAPAAKPAPRGPIEDFNQRWESIVGPRPAPRPAGPTVAEVTRPQTANEILGVSPYVHKDDPLSYEKREAITSEGYHRGLDTGTIHPEQQKMFEAKQAEDDRAEREKVLGISTGALTTTPDMLKEMTDRLTPEEYNALSARQRAAVDFNTILATAVKKDLNRQDRYAQQGDAAHERYDKAVKQMFGDDGGSDIYAPETVAALRQLKIDKDASADLDDYLGMKVAITADDLKNITENQPAPNYVIDGRAPEESRGKLAVVEGLVDKTQAMEQSLAKGKQIMQSFLATAAAERAEDLGNLGGSSPLASRPSLGFKTPKFNSSGAPGDLNTYFMQAFDTLADTKVTDKKKVLDELNAMLSPDELDAFKSYADARTRNTRYYGSVLGMASSDQGVSYDRPREIRKLLGLGKLSGQEE